MILTCPACASRYFVDGAKLPPQGRTVRCSSCSHAWRAEPEVEPLDLMLEPEPALDAFPDDPVRPVAEALPKQFRQKVEARRRTRQAVAAGVVWASLAAACAVLVLGAVIFRVQVVSLWPRTAGVYAAVRLPVNPLGLAPENIQAGQGLQNGRLALIVAGAERNVVTEPRLPAPVRVSVYDKGGQRLFTRTVRPSPGPIAPGESRPFMISVPDPPIAGVQVGVDFVVEPHARGTPLRRSSVRAPIGSSAAVAGPRLRGPDAPAAPVAAPKLARSIAPSSAYALPTAARAQTD